MDLVQAAVAEQFPFLVFHAVFLQETEGRPQAAAVHKFHDGKKFFELVFQRRSGKHKGVAALELFDGAGRGGGPISDALGFIKNDQVWAQAVHVLDILQHEFVAGEIEESRLGIKLFPVCQRPVDNLRGKTAEFLDFGFPLVLDRGGRNHQHLFNAATAPQQIRRGNGLNRLAQTHVVGQDHATPASRKKRASNLVGKEWQPSKRLRADSCPALNARDGRAPAPVRKQARSHDR